MRMRKTPMRNARSRLAHFRYRHRTWTITDVIRDERLPLYYVLDDVRTSDDEHEAICEITNCLPSIEEFERRVAQYRENQRLR